MFRCQLDVFVEQFDHNSMTGKDEMRPFQVWGVYAFILIDTCRAIRSLFSSFRHLHGVESKYKFSNQLCQASPLWRKQQASAANDQMSDVQTSVRSANQGLPSNSSSVVSHPFSAIPLSLG